LGLGSGGFGLKPSMSGQIGFHSSMKEGASKFSSWSASSASQVEKQNNIIDAVDELLNFD
jgi:hypothetical protein